MPGPPLPARHHPIDQTDPRRTKLDQFDRCPALVRAPILCAIGTGDNAAAVQNRGRASVRWSGEARHIMSLAVIHSRALDGLSAAPVSVEVHLANGLPSFTVVKQYVHRKSDE